MTKELKTQMLILGLIGYALGMMIGVFIAIFAGNDAWNLAHKGYFIANMIGSGLLGAVNMAGTIVYQIEDWGLTKATIVHYCQALGAFLIADFALGWFPMRYMIYVFAAFTVAYFIIWLIMFLRWKVEIKHMNNELMQILGKNN